MDEPQQREEYRPGTVRYRDKYAGGEWHAVAPQSPYYSSAIMIATEYWSEKHGWQLIDPSSENNNAG